MKTLTKEKLENIMDDVFARHIKLMQKPKRTAIPALDANGKFIYNEEQHD